MALTVVTDVSTANNSRTLSWTIPSLAIGDVVVISAVTWDEAVTLGTPSGTGLSFTLRVNVDLGSRTHNYIWTAVASSGGTNVVVTSTTSASNIHCGVCYVCPTADGYSLAGTPNTFSDTGSTGTDPPTGSISSSAGSLIILNNGDWIATTGTATYVGTVTQDGIAQVGGDVCEYFWHMDGSATSTSIGMTAPTSQLWAFAAIEVLKSGGGGGGNTTQKTMSDTLTLADPSVSGAKRMRITGDNLTLADAKVQWSRLVRVMSDMVTLTDPQVQWARFKRVMTDGIDFVDSFVKTIAGAAIVKVVSDTLSLADTAVQWLRRVRGPIDSMTLDDGNTYRQNIITASEGIDFSDGFVTWVRLKRVISENIDLIDGFSKIIAGAGITYVKVMSETITVIDNTGQRWTLRASRLTDAVGLSDAVVNALIRIRQLNETVEFSDGTVRIGRYVRVAQDQLDIPDDIVRLLVLDQLFGVNFKFGHSEPMRFGHTDPMRYGGH